MKNWQKRYPPYEGSEPYLYFAFAEADSAKAWQIMRILLERGCRVWYGSGPSGNADELLRRQKRAEDANLTLLYLTDAACADKDTKSNILVNQKNGKHILCLDPDGADRRLSMGLYETVPHLPLYRLKSRKEIENAVIRAEGFSQEILGEPVRVEGSGSLGKLTALFCVLAVLLALASFIGGRYLRWFQPEVPDEVPFTDPVILSAVRNAARGGAITEDLVSEITVLRLSGMPESWEELEKLPALTTVTLPQQALLEEGTLPDGDITVELTGGGA
ncbi:MAG: hypothetical protein IJK03_06370 [Oscillospiraceae bacterium]|nr:hypothetical protein [Oscillospiraceae bacterium]MBQ6428384.1 hypothetical protein [Oscillospiraceae bacterium]